MRTPEEIKIGHRISQAKYQLKTPEKNKIKSAAYYQRNKEAMAAKRKLAKAAKGIVA